MNVCGNYTTGALFPKLFSIPKDGEELAEREAGQQVAMRADDVVY
jgi:hypothetical protein